MSLEGAKLICLKADDNGQFETISANGKTFKFGYYMDCDVILEHPNAMGLQCVINCDAFGRVTIENRSLEQPITLDGKTLLKLRPLLHNTEICIFDKKYLWQFDGNPETKGFQMEDIHDFTTPSKQIKKPQQPPNSEPARKWRRPLQTRLTIHSFAYCIKAGESPIDIDITTDENKPLNIHEQIIDADIAPNKRLSTSPTPPENILDLINLNTPKQRSFSRKDQPLSCCKLSETVITSYSPRETGIRQEKSFAIVQSPLTASKVKLTDTNLGPFYDIASPQTIQNCRSSMHLIDLTTPKKLKPPASSPIRTLLKSTLKKNLPKEKSPQTPQKYTKVIDSSTPGSSNTVYSVRSTDDESIIILSDDCSGSPSPIAKTPPRARTPQSLMKRAILSSAKKVAINKKFLNLTGSKQTFTPTTSKNPSATRFQSQSTPQRKSLGRCPSSAESLSAGKLRRSLITSTPFRQRAEMAPASTSRRSLLINTQSSPKKESRNSLMLKQALSMTHTKPSMTQKRNSVTCMKIQNKPTTSVSFIQHVEKEEQTNIDEVDQLANHTFTIEEDSKNDIELEQVESSNRKDATFSPEKQKFEEECLLQSKVLLSAASLSNQGISTISSESVPVPSKTDSVMITSLERPTGSVVLHSADKSKGQASLETDAKLSDSLSVVSQVEIISDNQIQLDKEFREELVADKNKDQLSPQSSKINESLTGKDCQSIREETDYDFDGVDEIFKTPKAKNIMILSSPKSISLQKQTSDSVELIHSSEFDFSANLDELFQTPQSEFITRRVDEATPVTDAPIEALSPEEAFDMLVGRPIVKIRYARKTPMKKRELSPLKMSNDPNVPKTDIEEWIDSVNDLLEDSQGEDEMSYFTSTIDDISCDPLMTHSAAGSSNTNKTLKVLNTPRDEFEMTIKEENAEGKNKSNSNYLKDPLEMTVSRSLSPNISGIGLLDHTSESIFSETLAVSDDSSLKETEKTLKLSNDQIETTLKNNEKLCNVSQEDKARREIEEAFTNFEKQRKALDEKRLASTPEPKKPSISRIAKRITMGNQLSSDLTFDLNEFKVVQTEQKNQLNDVRLGESVSENVKKEMRNPGHEFDLDPHGCEIEMSLHKTLVSEEKLASDNRKPERFMGLEFDLNTKNMGLLENKIVVKSDTPKTLPTNFSEQQVAPEQKEISSIFQVKRGLELAFENFEERPEFSEKRKVKTPEPKKVKIKDHRRTLDSALVPEVRLDLQAAKAERELELAFENFEEQPEYSEERVVKTPEPKKVKIKDHRRTVGSALVSEVRLDLQAAKAERELELAFEDFEEQPEYSEMRVVKTPEPKKVKIKDNRRTAGSVLVPEVRLDLQAAKAEPELELAFENFEEQPEYSDERIVKTPEPKKVTLKDHRRTLGSSFVPEVRLDLQAAKAERELELAFENFEEQPEFSEKRIVKTPEPKKFTLKDHRRTLGSSLVPEVRLDLQAAKAERELELAFENFEEQPEFSEKRIVKTPEPKKFTVKDHRRTLGSALVPEVRLDLQAAKAQRELELAFENFEEQPEFSEKRIVKTPEPKKVTVKDHRRTLGSALVPEVRLDLQAAKAERELELAFENFEEQPEYSEKRVVKTPEPKKVTLKDHRRTLGSSLVPEVRLDLQTAKAKRELELAFENFEEQPEFSEKRIVKTPEPKKFTVKDHRRTLGSALVPEVRLDLQAAKAERELELAFENFEEQPEFSEKRIVKTPELKKVTVKDHRRTLGSALVPEVRLDLQAAKAERELELAFENFEEQPEFSEKRIVKTPEPKKFTVKDHRRTLGSALVPEVRLDLQAAKAERELELAFENFEEQPEFSEKRIVKTPEPKKVKIKDHRRTLGSALVPEVRLDLQAAKAERELELAFENFEEQPEFSEKRIVKTPEPKKVKIKDHRRTLGSALVPEVRLDLQAAKAQRELELAFENFEEQPEFSEKRIVKTPEPKKVTVKDHRRTLGSALVPEVRLDLQAAKAERELELAFENFEEQPEFSEKRIVKTPEPKKFTVKDHRRTLGSALVPEVRLDLQAAKAERELELAFENFEEQPEYSEERVVKTPEPKKVKIKDHRRTLGSALVPEVRLDLQAAKTERELELAFENFEERPEFSEKRKVKTPEPKKVKIKDHRRTLDSALVPEVRLDLQAAKAERELELAFENFEEQPEYSEERVVKTPEPKKVKIKDHRRTVGSALVPEVILDLQAAKAERELELAFENFEEQPEYSEERVVKTPEPKKVKIKDHRRTVGSALVPEVRLDLQAAKAERELELAFENFEEQPKYSDERVVKTPEPKKVKIKDHRRTVSSALVPEVRLDLQSAKLDRELKLDFENLNEQPEFSEQPVVKPPENKNVPVVKTSEAKKNSLKNQRKTVGSDLETEVKLDLQAAKTKQELELAFENFEEQPDFSEKRLVMTPELNTKDHRRTVGSTLVQEVKLDLQEAKTEREMELAVENFEEQTESSQVVKAPELSEMSLGSVLDPLPKPNFEEAKTSNTYTIIPTDVMNVTVTPQREPENIINETKTREHARLECTELERNNEEENQITIDEWKIDKSGSNILVHTTDKVAVIENPTKFNAYLKDKSFVNEEMQLKIVKKVILAKNKEHKVQKANRDFAKETYQDIASTSARSLRRRQKATAEEVKLKPNPIGMEQPETVNKEVVDKYENNKTVLRSTRKETVESLDDLKSLSSKETSMTHQSKSQENLPQMRRTRQNSLDTFTDNTKSTGYQRKNLESSNKEDEAIKHSTQQIYSTDVDSTEDESHHSSKNPSRKRVRKIVSKIAETPVNETELHHSLEPINEEGITPVSKITNQDIDRKSLIGLRAEAEEILSPIVSRSRIRGRKAQLNVVLIESNDMTTFNTDKISPCKSASVNNYIEMHNVGNSNEEFIEQIDITKDADESIPSTPLPLRSRGRRPSRTKVTSNLVVAGLRKTRKGSVQKDTEIQTIDKVEVVLKNNDNILKDETKSGNDVLSTKSDDEDIVPSTPVETKTRRRQLLNKQKITDKTSRKASSTLEEDDPKNILGKFVEPKEKIEQNKTEDIIDSQGNAKSIETENSIQEQENVTYKKDEIENTATFSSRTRGRKAIFKHEIVSESKTCDQAQKTTEDIPPNKQEDESSDKKTVQFTSKTVSEIDISESIQAKSPTVFDEKIISLRGQNSTAEGPLKNLEFESVEAEKPVETSPVLPRIRGRRAALKVHLDQQSITPNRRVGRPKKTHLPTEGAAQENDTHNDERSGKVVETLSSSSTQILTSPENTSNRRVGRSKAIEKTVPGSDCKSETSSGNDNCNIGSIVGEDASSEVHKSQEIGNAAPVVEKNMTSKTRARRAAVKPEFEVLAIKRNRKRAAEQIPDAHQVPGTENHQEVKVYAQNHQLDSTNQDKEAAQLVTPVPSKKRGRKAVEIVQVSHTPVIVTPKKTTINENKLKDEENVEIFGELPLSDVLKNHEIKNRNVPVADVENSMPPKTRGRRAAVKSENVVPTVKSGRNVVNEQISETQQLEGIEDDKKAFKINLQLDLANKEVDAAEQTVTPIKKRGRKAAVKVDPAVSPPAITTPVRRVGRRKASKEPILNSEKLSSPTDGENGGLKNEVVPINLLSSKTRGPNEALSLIHTRSVTENSTPVRRGVRRNIAGKAVNVQKSPESEKIKKGLYEEQDESAKLSPSISKSNENKVLLTLKSEEVFVESSSPIRRGGRIRGLQTNADNIATKSNVELPKSHGRKANQKIEVASSNVIEDVTDEDKKICHTDTKSVKFEPALTENSPSVQKEKLKRLSVQEEIIEKEYESTKQTDRRAFKEKSESLNESSTTDGDIYENVSAKKRTRRAPLKLTEFIVSNLIKQVKTEILDSKSNGSDTEEHSSTASHKPGQPVTAKFENVGSSQENSTPARKRSRRAIAKIEEHKESAPLQRVNRRGKAKEEAAITLIQGLQNNDNKNDTSCELISDEEKLEGKFKKKITGRNIALLSVATSPSLPISEEQQTEIEVRTRTKSSRGKGKAELKNNSTVENTSHADEEQSASTIKPKSNRGRKPATKSDPDNEITQVKPSDPGQNYKTKLEISQHEDTEIIDKKQKRGIKAPIVEPVESSAVTTNKPSPVTKKTTRGRKAAVKNDVGKSDDQSIQLDVQTRSGKDQDYNKETTKPVSKRRNIEILTNDDQKDTPSKRTRRKPNKLLSDSFIS